MAPVIRLEEIASSAGSAVKQVALDESHASWLVRAIDARRTAERSAFGSAAPAGLSRGDGPVGEAE
jgi:hypothetical protein